MGSLREVVVTKLGALITTIIAGLSIRNMFRIASTNITHGFNNDLVVSIGISLIIIAILSSIEIAGIVNLI